MNCIYAFLTATAYAYLACAVYTILGKPALKDISNSIQVAFYFAAFSVFLIVSSLPCPQIVYRVLGVIYGVAAMGSFIGYPQRWMAYWLPNPEKGSAAGQVGMAFWDLAISVACLMLV